MKKVNKKVEQNKYTQKELKLIEKALHLMQKKAKLEESISDLTKIINSKFLKIVIGTDSGAVTGFDELLKGVNIKIQAKDKLKKLKTQLKEVNKSGNSQLKAKIK